MKFLIVLLFCLPSFANESFRFSLYIEPHSLDPAKYSGGDANYFVSNLFRGLFSYDDKNGIVPVGAKSCSLKTKKLLCKLNPAMKWSSGEPVTANDYVRSFKHIINPESKAREAGLLLSLKHAKEILEGKLPPDKIGVTARDENTLEFEFSTIDDEFLFKLTSPLLVPLKVIPIIGQLETYVFNGPYKIKEWHKGKRVLLEANAYYPFGHKKRPSIEILFIEESATALDLYRLKKLDFVAELPVAEIAVMKNQKDFFRTLLARFDYFGFGDEFNKDKNLREALALSVDYHEFIKAFDSAGRPGCTGLPDAFMDKIPCLDFNLAKAKKAFEKVDKKNLEKKLKLYFTKIASNNLKTVAEWYQAQWKKHLGLEVELQPLEFAMYRQTLNANPPQFFRVGVSLDRPTCVAAIETFSSGNPDNFIRLKNPEYDKLVLQTSNSKTESARKANCRKAVEFLLSNYYIIPQGPIHFGRLLNPEYSGLKINSLGLVDFSNLHKN